MGRSSRISLVLVVALVQLGGATSAAEAQELVKPEARQGYYLGGGPRFGVAGADSDVGALGTMVHQGGWFRVGQKPFPWLGMGLAFGGGVQSSDAWTFGYGGLLLEAEFEPLSELDLALRVGTGVGGGGASRDDPSQEREDDPGFAFGPIFSAAVVYEWFPFYDRDSYDSGSFGIAVVAEGRYFPGGDVRGGGAFIGLELTWWTGLDKRKLELPVEEAF